MLRLRLLLQFEVFGRINIVLLVLKSKQRLNNNNIQTQSFYTNAYIIVYYITTYR